MTPIKVPDFGVDEDIKATTESTNWSQAELGLKWKPT